MFTMLVLNPKVCKKVLYISYAMDSHQIIFYNCSDIFSIIGLGEIISFLLDTMSMYFGEIGCSFSRNEEFASMACLVLVPWTHFHIYIGSRDALQLKMWDSSKLHWILWFIWSFIWFIFVVIYLPETIYFHLLPHTSYISFLSCDVLANFN